MLFKNDEKEAKTRKKIWNTIFDYVNLQFHFSINEFYYSNHGYS